MRTITICILFFIPILSFPQKIKLQKVANLPYPINESAGLALLDSDLIYTMNDNGGTNQLFGINRYGKMFFISRIVNVVNNDWEDLAGKHEKIFIGDFGNNFNLRKDLAIYLFEPQRFAFVDSFTASLISFYYPDQKQFPPSPSNWNFDCEAFFHHHDSLYLFSKNLSNPNDGYTKMYRLPDEPGNYVAQLTDSFLLNEPVTSADISPDGKTVVLLSYFSLWIFKNFPVNHFLAGEVFQFPFKGFTQREAICFSNDHELLISDERRFGKGGKLYKIDLNQLNFSQPMKKSQYQFNKRMIYNLFNNTKVKYKKIMRESPQ
ncbi:MAG: hypothetical protein LH473_08450 [Chitinophagales bacterium]|nr:hypothetical protein [Chitinophagales bacterium]